MPEDEQSDTQPSEIFQNKDQDKFNSARLSSDIAGRELAAQGIQGRAATMLNLSLTAYSREHTAGEILKGTELHLDTTGQRSLIERDLQQANPMVSDILWYNKDSWRDFLDFDYLNHTFSEDRTQLLKDAQVSFMLESFILGAWGRGHGENYWNTVNPNTHEELQKTAKLAIESANSGGWEKIAQVAQHFAESPLAEEMHQIAEIFNEKYFSPSSISGDAVDNILESYAVIKNPDAVMVVAKTVYKEGMGLDLDIVKPKLIPSYGAEKYN